MKQIPQIQKFMTTLLTDRDIKLATSSDDADGLTVEEVQAFYRKGIEQGSRSRV